MPFWLYVLWVTNKKMVISVICTCLKWHTIWTCYLLWFITASPLHREQHFSCGTDRFTIIKPTFCSFSLIMSEIAEADINEALFPCRQTRCKFFLYAIIFCDGKEVWWVCSFFWVTTSLMCITNITGSTEL